jgi:hypothetical protein
VYAVSPFARSDVKSQNLPSVLQDVSSRRLLADINLHCVSLIKPIRFDSSSVASGVGGTPDTKQNPNRSYFR